MFIEYMKLLLMLMNQLFTFSAALVYRIYVKHNRPVGLSNILYSLLIDIQLQLTTLGLPLASASPHYRPLHSEKDFTLFSEMTFLTF